MTQTGTLCFGANVRGSVRGQYYREVLYSDKALRVRAARPPDQNEPCAVHSHKRVPLPSDNSLMRCDHAVKGCMYGIYSPSTHADT